MEDKEVTQDTQDLTNSSDKPKKKRKDRRVEREYFDLIEVVDPSTGEIIKQRVKITKYKTKGSMHRSKPAVTEDDSYEPAVEDED